MPRRYLVWSPAVAVTLITAGLVALDLADRPVHRYWSKHSFTASVVSGLLVLLVTVLVVDRVVAMRQLRARSRAIAAQAAIIIAQANRTAEVIGHASGSDEERDQASDELDTYAQMLLISAPILIDAEMPRLFLEAAQRVAVRFFRVVRAPEGTDTTETKRQLDEALHQLRSAGAPLLEVLNRQELEAVDSDLGRQRS